MHYLMLYPDPLHKQDQLLLDYYHSRILGYEDDISLYGYTHEGRTYVLYERLEFRGRWTK